LETTSQGFPGVREMGDGREYPLPAPNYNTSVKDLVYKDLLTSKDLVYKDLLTIKT
jgi:hypothetical protein